MNELSDAYFDQIINIKITKKKKQIMKDTFNF